MRIIKATLVAHVLQCMHAISLYFKLSRPLKLSLINRDPGPRVDVFFLSQLKSSQKKVGLGYKRYTHGERERACHTSSRSRASYHNTDR